ncbi:MAG: hypothetical protein MZU95_08555 [Desulfomicrobium escambiense]|nr:hypothetical protein [Desulfomicrobium escambiense]
MDIKATDIKTLREKTGAGMMDCKKALVEAEGDFAAAEKLLKEWGLAGVEKRAGRATNEGKIFVKVEARQGRRCVELACETDFVCTQRGFHQARRRRWSTGRLRQGPRRARRRAGGHGQGPSASVIKENIALKRGRLRRGRRRRSTLHATTSTARARSASWSRSGSDKPEAFQTMPR